MSKVTRGAVSAGSFWRVYHLRGGTGRYPWSWSAVSGFEIVFAFAGMRTSSRFRARKTRRGRSANNSLAFNGDRYLSWIDHDGNSTANYLPADRSAAFEKQLQKTRDPLPESRLFWQLLYLSIFTSVPYMQCVKHRVRTHWMISRRKLHFAWKQSPLFCAFSCNRAGESMIVWVQESNLRRMGVTKGTRIFGENTKVISSCAGYRLSISRNDVEKKSWTPESILWESQRSLHVDRHDDIGENSVPGIIFISLIRSNWILRIGPKTRFVWLNPASIRFCDANVWEFATGRIHSHAIAFPSEIKEICTVSRPLSANSDGIVIWIKKKYIILPVSGSACVWLQGDSYRIRMEIRHEKDIWWNMSELVIGYSWLTWTVAIGDLVNLTRIAAVSAGFLDTFTKHLINPIESIFLNSTKKKFYLRDAISYNATAEILTESQEVYRIFRSKNLPNIYRRCCGKTYVKLYFPNVPCKAKYLLRFLRVRKPRQVRFVLCRGKKFL